MRIAVLGAGLAGLASAWYLANQPQKPDKITLYDPAGLAGGATGVGAGMFHRYAGATARLNRLGLEGSQETLRLINIAEEALGETVVLQKGILRIALTEQQRNDYALAAETYPDIEWLEPSACQQLAPGLIEAPGILIQSALTIDVNLYVRGLYRACRAHGVVFKKRAVSTLSELDNYDKIIVAIGSATTLIPECKRLPLRIVKGQILELEWPGTVAPPPFPVNSQAYLVMHPDGQTCQIGATYERQFTKWEADPEVARAELIPKVTAFYPHLEQAKVLSCRAGFRSSAPSHLPLIEQVNDKSWVIAGLGSKGLLYHAYFAKELASKLQG